MADPVFRSNLASSIETFISQKRASGYSYIKAARTMGELDSMITEHFPSCDTLTKEICDSWLTKCDNLYQNTRIKKITPVRQFGKYLISTGVQAYVIPAQIPGKSIHYEAHIYTENELTAFFAAVDKCLKSSHSPTRHYVVPVLFRLLFTCGLRSSEVRCLKASDVDLETGKIYIRNSKGWEARVIYVSADMLDLLRRYNVQIEKMIPDREPFFPNGNGDYFGPGAIDYWFHKFWDPLPEASVVQGNTPRVHDFRHTFCVYRLNQWIYENKDINALCPYLCEFVGHSTFADTDYYLKLAEPFYPEFQKRMHPMNENVLPEVPHEK